MFVSLKHFSHFLMGSLLIATCNFTVVTASYAEGAAHWAYDSSTTGPAHWGELSAEFATCKMGKNQSPIEIDAAHEPILDTQTPVKLSFNYRSVPLNVENNGHTIKVNYPADSGNSMTLNGKTYELKQFHFHTPPEHVLKTAQQSDFKIEMHLVHADTAGNLAVVGVLFDDSGVTNLLLKEIFSDAPKTAKKSPVIVEGKAINAADLLPVHTNPFYLYSGSLTTPPCSEGVQWIVLQQPLTTSGEQVEQLAALLHEHENNRPVQPRQARLVIKQQ